MFIDDRDQLDPRAMLPTDDRAWLRGRTRAMLEIFQRDLLAALGLDEHAVWCLETGRDRHGWLPAERERFQLWKATGGGVEAARSAWVELTRRDFVRHLIADRRIGVGDGVVSRG